MRLSFIPFVQLENNITVQKEHDTVSRTGCIALAITVGYMLADAFFWETHATALLLDQKLTSAVGHLRH
ncbi:hypothetical protein ACTXT7_010916 [Hymenolepis weldensis]